MFCNHWREFVTFTLISDGSRNISCQWRELGIRITITGGFLEYVLQSGAGVCSGFFQKHFKLMLENFRFCA